MLQISPLLWLAPRNIPFRLGPECQAPALPFFWPFMLVFQIWLLGHQEGRAFFL
jgi:hypothetical protein